VFRGVCRPDTDWPRVFDVFAEQQDAIAELTRALPASSPTLDTIRRYIDSFFFVLSSKPDREAEIETACRAPRRD
jgi:hypothetical protein